ncbi:MAG TPA: cytochrome c3 family protein [Kofleriaceae bacterium]|nr:cytochrome c3 family protein [Kofleriaceae bacterium]
MLAALAILLVGGGVLADRASVTDPVADPVADPAGDWSPVVYPLQRLPLTFSHARHLARGTACAACHPAATTSQSSIDNLIPTEAACRACHPIDRAQPALVVAGSPPVTCRTCHPGYTAGAPVAQVYLTPSPLKFDHSAHKAQPCATCHGDLRKVDLATTRQLPTMAACLRCHTDGGEPRHCADCHLAKLGGLIETSFPHGTLVPAHDGLGDAHGPDFKTHHTQEARQNGTTCAACHDQSECIACHQGVVKPLDFHPGNYVLTHAVEARRGTPDCGACHRTQSFCIGCHEREGLGNRGDTQFSTIDPARAFHPAGWASTGIGPNLHAREAKHSITSCTSCHREDDCTKCHSAQPGAAHISPHPKGWRGSAQCKAMDRGNRRMCLRCHIAQDELGCDWIAH